MLELYYFENSICSERALMTLAEKSVTDWVPHQVNLFNREQFDPAYLKFNPKAQVPTLVHNGAVIRESSLITDYLDAVFPEPALKPTEPAGIARMREWIKDADESGFEGVAALSFVSVFRDKILAMAEQDQESYWAKQTVLERKQRQQSCVNDGLDSPYALRAIATWERIFGKLEQALGDGRPWIMGDRFTLADLNLAPFVARLHGLKMTEPWLADAPNTQRWWQSVQSRPSYVQARVGPSKDEVTAMAQAGNRIQPAFEAKRAAYLKEYG